MVFRDGEFRRTASNKPMLFDGWGYVPVESAVGAESFSKQGASANPENVENNKQATPDRIELHQIML